MNNLESIEALIRNQINVQEIRVYDLTGTQDHLGITVVSPDFNGKILIDQHQMIMDILKPELKEKIHAVQIKTLTPEKFEKRGSQL